MLAFKVEEEGSWRTKVKYKQYGEKEWKTSELRPYFYVDADEGYSLPDRRYGRVERDPGVKAYDGTPLHRVVLDSDRNTKECRGAAENHFEADIPFVRRFYIDEVEEGLFGDGDVNGADPHVMHVDIEVASDGGGVDAMAAEEAVVSVSCYSERTGHTDFLLEPDGWERPGDAEDGYGPFRLIEREWDGRSGEVRLFERENDMLASLGRFLKDERVEVMTGWNFESFDAAYLINRAGQLKGIEAEVFSPLGDAYASEWYTKSGNRNVSATIKGIDIVDMAAAYKHLRRRNKPPNWRLDTVATHEGLEAEKIPFDTSRMKDEWEADPMAVMEYNRRDALLTHLVDEEVSAFDQFVETHRQLAVPLPDTLKMSVLVEMFVMSRSPDWGIERRILDSKRDQTNDFEGGNTKQPNPGLYEWVFSVDVTSEYPNWVRAANISPETVVTKGDPEWGRDDLITTPEDGIRFLPHEERLGILPRAVDEMFDLKARKTRERAEHEYGSPGWKQADLERDASKWLLNAIQGVTGMETHRLSKNEVSVAITSFGRETVEHMVEEGEAMGHSFVYGDTDSVFLTDKDGDVAGREETIEAAKRLAERVNGTLPDWARDEFGITDERREKLEVEPDKVAMRAFFPNKKKRYSLWLVWSDGSEIDKVSHTGWAIVRSDTSDVEYRVQERTLEALMHNRNERFITARLTEEVRRVADGEYAPIEMARPQGSSKDFAQYGDGSEETLDGVPYFVAAMLSSNELLGADWRGGDKAWMLPVRETHTVELNGSTNTVNYLAIDEDTQLPDDMKIDEQKVIDNIIGKVERIYDSLGWDLTPLTEAKQEAAEAAEVERIQENNHTLGAFSS